MSMCDAARDLVIRAREGDQNAMAIIALVGKNARREGKSPTQIKSRVAYACLQKAVNEDKIAGEKPLPPKPLLIAVREPETFVAAYERLKRCEGGLCSILVALANGPALSLPRLESMSEAAGEHAPAQAMLKRAHTLQRVRRGAPIRFYSRDAAWELGE